VAVPHSLWSGSADGPARWGLANFECPAPDLLSVRYGKTAMPALDTLRTEIWQERSPQPLEAHCADMQPNATPCTSRNWIPRSLHTNRCPLVI
jgi:hypothetical protein